MTEGSTEDALLEYFVAAQRRGIGRFTADLVTGRWAWSRSLDVYFGSPAAGLAPSWDQVLDHIPDEEREIVVEAFRQASSQAGPFSWSHRVRTDDGSVRSVLVIGESTVAPSTTQGHVNDRSAAGVNDRSAAGVNDRSAAGVNDRSAAGVVSLTGYVIDLTELRVHGAHAAADEAVQRSAAHRATIEQAKGALMLVYRLTPQAAFALLAWHSQRANRKLHLIAADLMQAFQDHDLADGNLRATVDQLLHDAASRRKMPPDGVASSSGADS
ncbi:MAG TPA: ANTAR domain-containing protein [Microlunatus sp.]|nr:ANTAR domain-containing protein [Microlunatus sp.]